MPILNIKPYSDEWYELRKNGLGGSDVAAALGLSKWKTPYQLWREKIGKDTAMTPQNEAMEWGHRLEQVIRQKYCDETGKKIVNPSCVFGHDDYDFLFATIDGITDCGRLLEIKTSRYSDRWGSTETEEIPVEYYLQVQLYLLITKCKECDVAVLIGGNEFRLYVIVADADLQQSILESLKEFWDSVKNNTEPNLMGIEDIKLKFPESVDSAVEANEDIVRQLNRIKTNIKCIKDCEQENETLKSKVMSYMGDNDTITRFGDILATWKSNKKGVRRFLIKGLESDQR